MPEILNLPMGQVIFAHITPELSMGLLKLNPNQQMEKHNRPVEEQLFQVSGECKMIIFDDEEKEITLKEGDTIRIPANKFHIHSALDKQSITLWKFEGDVTEIIKKMKEKFGK
jgi:quercetin dioxygenase-like cupin family protein